MTHGGEVGDAFKQPPLPGIRGRREAGVALRRFNVSGGAFLMQVSQHRDTLNAKQTQ